MPTARLLLLLLACQLLFSPDVFSRSYQSRGYYLDNTGNDFNDGSKEHPLKTIDRLNAVSLHGGDTVYFKSGEIFAGQVLIDSSKAGQQNTPLVITSYGDNNATIDGGNTTALTITNSSFIKVYKLNFNGAGRKEGNTKDGVAVLYSHDITLDDISIQGFQKAGLLVYSSVDVRATKVYAHNNGFAGIFINGDYQKRNSNRIYLGDCKAENNPGDPTNLTNHSGNGIIAGNCKNLLIEYCTATNNGWDMPRIGNGPVGIWCYEADSVVIQHCISYRNKTSKGSDDGGGFDLDGGVTNSVIQYCLSYENDGSGYGIFQYDGASNWHDNTIRFCISENDGAVSTAHAGVLIWNSSHDTAQFKRCYFYNNVVYNNKTAAICYADESEQAGFYFLNNIFVAKDSILTGKEHSGVFLANDWWSLNNRFNIAGIKDFTSWLQQYKKEQYNGSVAGLNIKPKLKRPGKTSLANALKLNQFKRYRIPRRSRLRSSGINLLQVFGIANGGKAFNQNAAPEKGIGTCF